MGGPAFYAKYGFGQALEYFLIVDNQRYDSKAILAAAQGFEHPDLGPAFNDFSGGKPVQRALERLGFTVQDPDNTSGVVAPSGARTRDAIHLVVKWSARYGADTVTQHQAVAELRGAVWWGLRSDTDFRVSERWVSQLREQLAGGTETFVFISGPSCWRTKLLTVTYEAEDVEADLIPTYYPSGARYHLWVKLTDFRQVERNELLRGLDPVAHPGRPVALGNQTNPLIVSLRTTPRVWWVNQGSSFRRASEGGYLWAPLVDKGGKTPEHWASCVCGSPSEARP